MNSRKMITLLAAACMILSGCAGAQNAQSAEVSETSSSGTSDSGADASASPEDQDEPGESSAASSSGTKTLDYSAAEMFTARDYEIGYSDCTEITLSDNGITVNGSGASAEGSAVTITEAGSYLIKGSIANGQIIVDANDEKLQLVLDGADVTCTGSAALLINTADKGQIS